MSFQIRFLDNDQHLLASAFVEDVSGCFSGPVNLSQMPAPMRQVFEEYEELVNTQAFSLLDEIENRIAAMPIRAFFDDGRVVFLNDLQIFPKAGKVSFRVGQERTRQTAHVLGA